MTLMRRGVEGHCVHLVIRAGSYAGSSPAIPTRAHHNGQYQGSEDCSRIDPPCDSRERPALTGVGRSRMNLALNRAVGITAQTPGHTCPRKRAFSPRRKPATWTAWRRSGSERPARELASCARRVINRACLTTGTVCITKTSFGGAINASRRGMTRWLIVQKKSRRLS